MLNAVKIMIQKNDYIPQKTIRVIETVSPEGTFCDTVQVPSGAGDMQLN